MENDKIKDVAKDIINLRFEPTHTLSDVRDKFFDIMRKHDIKMGTENIGEDGIKRSVLCSNYEWTMCQNLFMEQVKAYYQWSFLLEVPEDVYV